MKYTTFRKAWLKGIIGFVLMALAFTGQEAYAAAPGGIPDFGITDADLDGIYNYLANLDDKGLAELEELTRKTLADIGLDYDKLPTSPQIEAPLPVEKKIEVASPEIKQPEPSSSLIKSIKETLNALIVELEELRLKAATTMSYDTSLNRWLPDINTLVYYIRTINNSDHYKRLAAPEYDALRQSLERLNRALRTYQPLLAVPVQKPESYEDPYDILGVLSTATAQDIEKAYSALKELQDPDALKIRLAEQGWAEAAIDQAVKEARLNFDFITDAYQKLKDPLTRALIDKELQAYYTAEKTASRSLEYARDALVSSIGDAIFKDAALTKLEQFLKQYEPAQLEARKNMELAETERLKEYTTEAKTKQYGGKTIVARSQQPREMPWDMADFFKAPSPQPSFSPPAVEKKSPPPPANEKAGGKSKPFGRGKGGGGKAKGKDKDKDKEEKDKGKEAKEEDKQDKGGQGAKAESPKSEDKKDDKKGKKDDKKKEDGFDILAQKFADLDEQLFRFNQSFDKEFFLEAQINPQPLEQFLPNIQAFGQAAHLNDLGSKLNYIEKTLDEKDKRKNKQYKTLWKNLSKNTKEFKTNADLASLTSHSYLSKKNQANPAMKDFNQIVETLDSAIKSFKKIDEALGEKKNKTQQALSPFGAPRR